MSWKKGALIGGIIFIILVIIYKLSGLFSSCITSGEGFMCTNHFQDILLIIFFLLSLPSMLLEIGSPSVSTGGSIGVAIFWVCGFVVSLIIGAIIGLIIGKKKGARRIKPFK